MYSVNLFGNSTLPCNAGSIIFLLYVFEMLNNTGICLIVRVWIHCSKVQELIGRVDSRSIEIFSSLLFPLPELISKYLSDHCKASSNLFFLHVTMMSLYWIAPCNRVMTF